MLYCTRLAETLMKRYPDPDSYPYASWSYPQGFLLWGFIRLYEKTGDTTYRDYVMRYCEEHVGDDGTVSGFTGVSLDDMMSASVLVWAYTQTHLPKYKLACEQVRRSFDDYPRNPDGGFWHSRDREGEMWVDGLFMGQMFLVRCPRRDAAQKAAEYHLGGYLLFSEDFEGRTPQTAAAEIASYQAAATVPLFIGVDEEGGAINRISRFSAFRAAPFPSPQQLYQADGLAAVRRDTLEKCAFLRGLGINMNFAPVCDVSTEESDFIYARTLGQGPQQTAAYAREVVQAMAGQGVASVLKHFPGYGNNADTHTGIAHDMRSYETFEQADFVPFRAGIEAGANVVLVCHNIVECMDASMPASLSPRVHEILRQELGFSGVIVTDDLYMRGIRDFMGPAEAAVQAVLAGNDLLCCTEFEVQVPAVVEAVRHGVINQAQVDASVLRILRLKQALGLL